MPSTLRKDTCTSRQGANSYNLFLCSFRTIMHTFFSLNPFRCNSNHNIHCQGGCCFWCGIFWFFSQFGGVKLPYSCQSLSCTSGEADEFIINKSLSWGLEWSWSVCLPSFSFKDTATKASSPSKTLSFLDSPRSCSAAPVQPPLLPPHLLIYCLWTGWGVAGDESHGNYRWHICSLLVSSLSSLGFTLILFSQQSDKLPRVLFFLLIVPERISLSQPTLSMQGGGFVYLLTETGFSVT